MTSLRSTDAIQFKEIASNVHMASRRFTNVYAIVADGATTLVDTGEPSFATPLLSALKALPPVEAIVLTHAHYDHVGSAAAIAHATGAAIHMHPLDAALLSNGRWRRPARPSPTILGRLLTRIVAGRYPDEVAPVETVRPIIDQTLTLSPAFEVIHFPGHSEGQIGLRWTLRDGQTAIIVGDTIMNVLGPTEPILYEHRATGLASINRLAQLTDKGTLILPGHGRPLVGSHKLKAQLERLSQGPRQPLADGGENGRPATAPPRPSTPQS